MWCDASNLLSKKICKVHNVFGESTAESLLIALVSGSRSELWLRKHFGEFLVAKMPLMAAVFTIYWRKEVLLLEAGPKNNAGEK